jgi:hypothetical protein
MFVEPSKVTSGLTQYFAKEVKYGTLVRPSLLYTLNKRISGVDVHELKMQSQRNNGMNAPGFLLYTHIS